MRKNELRELSEFILRKRYVPIAESILKEIPFSLPCKRLINKVGSTKKRVVYTYSKDENHVLKLITSLLYRYDAAFAGNLYSFRQSFGVKKAFCDLKSHGGLSNMCSYKADIRNYFNSVDVEMCIKELQEVITDDKPLLDFITRLLREERVMCGENIVPDSHGIMAGVPISSFLANVYLRKMDRWFEERGIIYARYSDDIIVFAATPEKLSEYVLTIKDFLKKYKLEVNPSKEIYTEVGEMWTFLGIKYSCGETDIAPISLDKVKAKMRRKSRALLRWKRKKELENIHAVKAFIKFLNRYFYCNSTSDEMTWSRWYFPLISTDVSIKEIDRYALELIRYIYSEKHSKASYNFRYSDIKALGYRPLVSEYYSEEYRR